MKQQAYGAVIRGFGMDRELSSLLAGKLKKSEREKVTSLLEYLKNNAHRLNYCEWLSEGRAIGSGLIEGACKNLIGLCCWAWGLKQTKACWRVPRANKIAIICAIMYSDQWEQAWHNSS
jgi:hypothetical protein